MEEVCWIHLVERLVEALELFSWHSDSVVGVDPVVIHTGKLLLRVMKPQDTEQEPEPTRTPNSPFVPCHEPSRHQTGARTHENSEFSLCSLPWTHKTLSRSQDPWKLNFLCSLPSCLHLSYFHFECHLAAPVQRLLTAVASMFLTSMFLTCHSFTYNLIHVPWTGFTFCAAVLARVPKDFQVTTTTTLRNAKSMVSETRVWDIEMDCPKTVGSCVLTVWSFILSLIIKY